MGKKMLRVYLAKDDTPYSAAYAKLDLPASPWEVWDAMEKVRLQTDDILYMEIEDYFAFEYLSPHLDGLDISLNELNDLAVQLAALDEVQGIAFEGLFSMEVQRKVNANGGVITLQNLRNLAVSAKTDCYHVVDAADDAQLGRFYAENDFVPELEGISNEVFEMLDFASIGKMMRHSENGVFVGSLYVLQDGELTTAPPVQRTLTEKPGYLFRLTLGLHPDIGDERTVTLDTVDRQPQNGGNGLGCQDELAYTLTATDRHCIYARQRVDVFKDGEVVSTQSARQHKDATDLVVDVAGLDCRNAAENGDLCGTLQKGTSGSSLNSIHPIRNGLLIRRLTPLECERLQGFPDGWTDIPGASDSARYKALGNSVAIPCVEFIMSRIAAALL